MLEEIKTPDRAESWLKEKLATKEKVMGFGHRVYKKGDSRVPLMREIGRDLGKRTGKDQWIPICEKLEEVMEREKHLCANVDLYAAPVLWMLGFPPELNTPIFAASRVAGWCAHVVEQHDNNRLIRPRSALVERRYNERIAVTSGKVRTEQCLLGLWAGESRRATYPELPKKW